MLNIHTTQSPDHPPLKQLYFLFYLGYHAGFEFAKYPNCQNGNMTISLFLNSPFPQYPLFSEWLFGKNCFIILSKNDYAKIAIPLPVSKG